MSRTPSRLGPFLVRRWLFLLLASLLAVWSPPTQGAPSSSNGVVDQLGQQVQATREALYRGEGNLDGTLQRLRHLAGDLETAAASASE